MGSDLACNRLFRLVRDFAQKTPSWGTCIVYDTKPDERFDLTLVASRVYGSGDDFLTIQAAAGLDSPECALTERRLILPTLSQLAAMKKDAGYG